MRLFLLSLFLFLSVPASQAAAAPSPSPSPSPLSVYQTQTLSERKSLDDMTYANKMKYRKDREEYNKLVADYNEMVKKKAQEAEQAAAAQAAPKPRELTYAEKKAEKARKEKLKKRVLIA